MREQIWDKYIPDFLVKYMLIYLARHYSFVFWKQSGHPDYESQHDAAPNIWFTALVQISPCVCVRFVIIAGFIAFFSFIRGCRGGGRTRCCCVRSFAPESRRRDRNKEINRSLIFWFSRFSQLRGCYFTGFGAWEEPLMSVVPRRWVNIGVFLCKMAFNSRNRLCWSRWNAFFPLSPPFLRRF